MIDDVFYYTIMLFAVAAAFVGVIIYAITLGQVSDSLPLTAADNATMHGVFARFPTAFDNMLTFVLFGLMIVSLGLLYFLRVSTAWFFIVVICMSVAVVAAGAFANAWSAMKATPALAPVLGSNLTRIGFFMEHYMIVTLAYIILAMIVFFAKPVSDV